MKVLVFGYSENPERYSYKAAELLKAYNHETITINPRHDDELKKIHTDYHTLTLYVNPQISSKYQDLSLKSKPKRVIFNPGTENPAFYELLKLNNIEVEVACTLVMLSTSQY